VVIEVQRQAGEEAVQAGEVVYDGYGEGGRLHYRQLICRFIGREFDTANRLIEDLSPFHGYKLGNYG